MKNKFIALMLILSASFILASCGTQNDGDSNSSRENRGKQQENIVEDTSFYEVRDLTLSEYCGEYNDVFRKTISDYVEYKNASDKEYLSAAKVLLEDVLLDPDSAKYHDSYIVERDGYGRVMVYFDVTCNNAYGGVYRSNMYVCVKGIGKDGTIYSDKNAVQEIENENGMGLYKALVHWNTDPIDETLSDFLLSSDSATLINTYNTKYGTYDEYQISKKQFVQSIFVQNNIVQSIAIQIVNDMEDVQAEGIRAAIISALTGQSLDDAEEFVAENIYSAEDDYYFDKGLVYENYVNEKYKYFIVTIVDESQYKDDDYWTPTKKQETNSADNEIEESDISDEVDGIDMSMYYSIESDFTCNKANDGSKYTVTVQSVYDGDSFEYLIARMSDGISIYFHPEEERSSSLVSVVYDDDYRVIGNIIYYPSENKLSIKAENYNSPLFDYVGDYYKDGSNSASDTYYSEEGFLYDGACFALYETLGESDDIVYIAERDGKLCISFDDINYIPLSYSEAKEGYDAYPSDDAESHIIIKETTVNGAFGIEIMSSGSYGKYCGEYIGIPDRDMWE